MSEKGASKSLLKQAVEEPHANVLIPVFLLGPLLRQSLQDLYGGSREARVLDALLTSGPLTLSGLCRQCSASERAVRMGGHTGWLRAILLRYCELGVVVERDMGNRITYELVASSATVSLLRELKISPAFQPHR